MGMDDDLQSGLLVVGILLLLLGGGILLWGLLDVTVHTEQQGILGTGGTRTTTSYNEPALLVGGMTLLAGVLFLAVAGAGDRPGAAVVVHAAAPPRRAHKPPMADHGAPEREVARPMWHHPDDPVPAHAGDRSVQESHVPVAEARDPADEVRNGIVVTGILLAALFVVFTVLYALGALF